MEPEDEGEEEDFSSEEEETGQANNKTGSSSAKKSGGFGLFSGLRDLVGSKALTRENIQVIYSKKNHKTTDTSANY